MNQNGVGPTMLVLTIVAFCLFEFILQRESGVFHEWAAAAVSLQRILLACLTFWCGTFIFLTFRHKNWPILVFLPIALTAYFIRYTASRPVLDAIILVFGVTLGKGACFALKADCSHVAGHENVPELVNRKSAIINFLVGLIGLLAFSSWWHLDMSDNFYHGPRWMGLWNNPNIYGMLMSAGTLLAIGFLVASLKPKFKSSKLPETASTDCADFRRFLPFFNRRKSAQSAENIVRDSQSMYLQIFLFIAVGMMGVGLVMSYSRGALLGTAIGLLYLARQTNAESVKHKSKTIWYFLVLMVLAAAVVLLCWGRTPDSAPWFIKRADLGRPSAQHRVAAWKAGFEIMRDHPFGVGWNNSIQIYQDHYHPPEDGAAAITTNDYLMIGTQLGIPALICFLAYVALCFRTNHRNEAFSAGGCGSVSSPAGTSGVTPVEPADELATLRVACRSGALAMLVAFWFDGGLFQLPTAALFWVLLELGSQVPKPFCPNQPTLLNNSPETSGPKTDKSQSPF